MTRVIVLVLLVGLIISAGCTEWENIPIIKNVTVSDRVMTVGFGTICGCHISTTDGEAYAVQYYNNCAKLTPGKNVTLTIENQRDCEVTNVRPIP